MVTIHLLLYAIQFWLYSTFTHVTTSGQLYRSLVGSFGRSLSSQIARANQFSLSFIVYLSSCLLCIQSFVFSLVSQVFIF